MASGSTPIWGRPYPLNTDAPNVHTDIQALATSLETVPLYPTTAATSRTGTAGESVVVSPSQTLTLPATPVKGDRIQIIALGTVTATTPVTVATAGGKVINGVGLTSASSFLLGAANANATVQYDGTAWRITEGAQDTGWLALPFSSPFGHQTGASTAGRQIANRVELRSVITASAPVAQGQTACTFPAALGLPYTGFMLISNGGSSRLWIQAPGVVIGDAYGNNGGIFYLEGINYLTD